MNWYYILSEQSKHGSGWIQMYKGMVQATTKKEARRLVEEEFGKESFPMKIKKEDVKKESILLALYEMKEGEYKHIWDSFKDTECKECKTKYTPINAFNLRTGGNSEFCSSECKDEYQRKNILFDPEYFNYSIPVIYKITQKSTGKVYIGQTIRSFTLRWWEHIKSIDDVQNKFHNELTKSQITDWTFEVIEEVKDKCNLREKEQYWIKYYDSVNIGFNSIQASNNECEVTI